MAAGYSTQKDVFRPQTYSSQCNYIGITARPSKWEHWMGSRQIQAWVDKRGLGITLRMQILINGKLKIQLGAGQN